MQKNGAYRELTWTAVLGGVLIGAVLNMGICYAGMQIGFTIVGSTVAAVIGFGILRGVLRRGSILEVNVFQTVASGVNTVNGGIIFTVPVLFLLGLQDQIDYRSLILACVAGSLLGVVMIIPMRKQIIDFERLRFPEGIATATILKSPGAGVEKAKLLVISVLVSAGIMTLTKIPWGDDMFLDLPWLGRILLPALGGSTILPEEIHLGKLLGIPAGLRMVFALHLLSLGAGYLAGRHGLVILYGTLLNFWVLIPIGLALGWVPQAFSDFSFWATTPESYVTADGLANAFRGGISRHVGIGMILGGAIAGIMVALPALKAALASLKSSGAGGERDEVSANVLNGGLAIGMLLLFFAAKLAGGENVGWGTALAVTLAGGAWLWLAGLVVAQTTGRTDWSPLSGLALIAIAIMMGIMGTGREMIVPAVTIGAAICVATSMCADMMADLKTGYLVGSKPIKQQVAQIATCWIGPPIALATVILLWNSYGFGPSQAEVLYEREVAKGPAAVEAFEARGGAVDTLPAGMPELSAPQAGALEAAIEIVQQGDVPLGKYLTGAALGLVVSLAVSPGLGVMVGLSLYLPFTYMIVFGVGGIISILVMRWKGARFAEDKGVPIAAGLIVGDALVGITDAVIKVVSGSMGGGA